MIEIPLITTAYLSSHTSSHRAVLKMLLTISIWPRERNCRSASYRLS